MFNDIKATNKRVNGQIKAIGNRNKTLRNMIQSTLYEIAAHAYQHGDVTLYDKLLDAVRSLIPSQKIIIKSAFIWTLLLRRWLQGSLPRRSGRFLSI